ncbi:FAD/NAD(P)-binding domain-containing protein [Gymnopus androsaceus JB14]|uniref:FAD/NAD(P)-binding domain-containing protein n=1 Tax=Gymnopus androsaceus JB14 TaxID=1447944 RepID=A0A6A4IRF3_9AGAR|nr:FAD/NAD(P)-binding domain-containing protein [Gymnopus androsaceus JB14]
MSEGAFDVIIIGTGLTESITAVAHLDTNPYYGGDEASLSLDEYVDWVTKQNQNSFSSISALNAYRQYSITLCPSVIPATGPLISSLVASGVSRYGGFRLIEQIGVYSENKVKPVPASKEDIFKDKSISLLEKRRLMRFLVFASGDFEGKPEMEGKEDIPFIEFLKTGPFALNAEMAETITYALSFCILPSGASTTSKHQTGPALHRLRRYLRSAGRYGPSPFLIGHYGSSGEIAQGFCRTAAVSGGVYILGKPIASITRNADSEDSTYTVKLEDFPEPITCDLIISSASRLPAGVAEAEMNLLSASIARCICIIDKPLSFAPPKQSTSDQVVEPAGEGENETPSPSAPALDTGVLVFPPSSLPNGSDSAAGTMSVPKGKCTFTIPGVQDPERLLKPYLDATLSLSLSSSSSSAATPVDPLFTSFYIQSPSSSSSAPSPSAIPNMQELGRRSCGGCREVFWKGVEVLKSRKGRKASEEAVSGEGMKEGEFGVEINIESFWPSIGSDVDEDGDDD